MRGGGKGGGGGEIRIKTWVVLLDREEEVLDNVDALVVGVRSFLRIPEVFKNFSTHRGRVRGFCLAEIALFGARRD